MKLTIPFLPRNSSFDFLYKNYRIIDYVGKGQFGNTYMVENTKDCKIWLAKCIDLSQMDEDDKKRSLQEAEIMKSINHPNVIKCHESFMHDDVYLVIIMEYCEKGDIGALIDSCLSKGTFFTEKTILYWCAQLAAGLYYLHNECRIIHRDIKPSNIFIRDNGDLVIGDFGISRIMLSVTMPFTLTSIGTPQYMSPEMCENKPYTYKSDIWSFGCVLYELTCLKPPFSGDSLLSLAWKISFQEIEPLPSCYSCDLFKLIQRLLSRDPILRPGPIEILNDKLLQEFTSSPGFLANYPAEVLGGKARTAFKSIRERALSESGSSDRDQLDVWIPAGTSDCQMGARPDSMTGSDMKDARDFSSGRGRHSVHEEKGWFCEMSYQRLQSRELAGHGGGLGAPASSTFPGNIVSRSGHSESQASEGERLRGYCDRLTSYEDQYFSVLVGRIQHHISRCSERGSSGGFSSKEDVLAFLTKRFKSCRGDLCFLDCRMTSEWFSEFVEELGVGLSESEVSLFLSYIGHFMCFEAEDSYSECADSKKNGSNYKIRQTRSSGNLLSLEGSRTARSLDLRTSKSLLGNADLGEKAKHSELHSGESFGPNVPMIRDFVEKICTWNKVRFSALQREECGETGSLGLERGGPSGLFPISPVVSYNDTKLRSIESIEPCFYLFITDWIQSILTPVLALNSITYSSGQSALRQKNITLRQGFHLFDQKIQGTLSRQHFRTVLYLILPKLTSVQLDWLYALAPKDLTGNVKYEQFLEFIDSIQRSGRTGAGSFVGGCGEEVLCGLTEERSGGPGEEAHARRRGRVGGGFLEISGQEPGRRSESRSFGSSARLQSGREEAPTVEELGLLKGANSYDGGGTAVRGDEVLSKGKGGFCELPNIQQELYGFGIQDVVLHHYNSLACMNRRPSPSPQLLARARTASFIRSSRRGSGMEAECQNKENALKLNVDSSVTEEVKRKSEVLAEERQVFEVRSQVEGLVREERGRGSDRYEGRVSMRHASEEIIGLSKELEGLIQKLQIERIYTCWITARASESQEDLFSEVFEKLVCIRQGTSLALDLVISNLQSMKKSLDLFDSILELDSILVVLKEELPLQRDAIDCILRVIDHMELSSEKEILSIGMSQLNSSASEVYKHIMKQAISNNMVLPISAKGKYSAARSFENGNSGESASLMPEQQTLQTARQSLAEEVGNSRQAPSSRVFDWTGKFLASFEFFGEATVNLIQCGISILECTRSLREEGEKEESSPLEGGTTTGLRNFSQLNFLIENYRQWSHLKEHVSRECAFVASIGANHDIRNDMETARIFLELLGARRFQVNVTWQKQSGTEQQLFRELFLLEESLWNSHKFCPQAEDALSSKRRSDSELWLLCGERACGALHNTCNKFISEIQSLF